MIAIDLSEDVVLVMGGGGSIGSAIARASSSAGAKVAVADSNFEKAQAVAAEIRSSGGQCEAFLVDLADSESIRTCVKSVVELWGQLTGLVNAAGLWRSAPSEQMTDEMWVAMMDVNFTGVFRASREAVPHLKTAGRGSIVNISSVAAFAASAESAPYSASRAGVIGYSTGLSGELAPFGVRVNTICPGWVDGGFTHNALAKSADPAALRAMASEKHLLGRMASPADIGNAAAWLLSDLASFVTGTTLFVDGGYMAKH